MIMGKRRWHITPNNISDKPEELSLSTNNYFVAGL